MTGSSSKLWLVKTSNAEAAGNKALIDEFGELKRQEAAFQPIANRIKVLRSTIAGWVPVTYPADQPVTFSGKLYDVNCTPQEIQRSVPQPAKLLKFLGAARFWLLCRIGVTALEECVGKENAAPWFVQERTGPRTITAVAKASPAAPGAA